MSVFITAASPLILSRRGCADVAFSLIAARGSARRARRRARGGLCCEWRAEPSHQTGPRELAALLQMRLSDLPTASLKRRASLRTGRRPLPADDAGFPHPQNGHGLLRVETDSRIIDVLADGAVDAQSRAGAGPKTCSKYGRREPDETHSNVPRSVHAAATTPIRQICSRASGGIHGERDGVEVGSRQVRCRRRHGPLPAGTII